MGIAEPILDDWDRIISDTIDERAELLEFCFFVFFASISLADPRGGLNPWRLGMRRTVRWVIELPAAALALTELIFLGSSFSSLRSIAAVDARCTADRAVHDVLFGDTAALTSRVSDTTQCSPLIIRYQGLGLTAADLEKPGDFVAYALRPPSSTATTY